MRTPLILLTASIACGAALPGQDRDSDIRVVGRVKPGAERVGLDQAPSLYDVIAGCAGAGSDVRGTVVLRTSGKTLEVLRAGAGFALGGEQKFGLGMEPGDIVFLAPRVEAVTVEWKLTELLPAVFAGDPPASITGKIFAHLEATLPRARDAKATVPARLLFVAYHRDPMTRVRHLQELGMMGADAATAVPAIIDALDAGGRITAEAVTALGMIGPPAVAALPRLEQLATGGDPKLGSRLAAARKSIRAPGRTPDRAVAAVPPWTAPEMDALQLRRGQAMDARNLRWHFQAIINYRAKYKTPPRGGGAQFVLDGWVRGVVERTTENQQRYFSTVFAGGDAHYRALLLRDAKDLWQTRAAITARDTHFFAIAKDQKRGMWSGERAWMCTPMYPDGTVHVLYGDGSVKLLPIDPKDRAQWTPAALGLTK